jgi:hypothetical protein
MTKDEAIKSLEAMPAGGDNEAQHGEADEILLSRLEQLGEGDVVTAFRDARNRCAFWYA